MNSYDVVKGAAGLIVGTGASKVVKQVIVHNTHLPESKMSRYMFIAGAWGIGSLVGERVEENVERGFDKWRDAFVKARQQLKDAPEKIDGFTEKLDVLSDGLEEAKKKQADKIKPSNADSGDVLRSVAKAFDKTKNEFGQVADSGTSDKE